MTKLDKIPWFDDDIYFIRKMSGNTTANLEAALK